MATKKAKSEGETKSEKERILEYLENQLKMKKERLKTFEEPITPETIKDVKKVEEMILKNQIWSLEDYIQVIKMLD